MDVRPTPDRLREALFNVLVTRIKDVVFLDAYAGSGAVGIEALSRGAKRVILIERNARALAVIRENLDSLQIKSEVTVVRGSARILLPNYPAEIAFVDPPYNQTAEYEGSLLALAATTCSLVIAQHPSQLSLTDSFARLHTHGVLKHRHRKLSYVEPRPYRHSHHAGY